MRFAASISMLLTVRTAFLMAWSISWGKLHRSCQKDEPPRSPPLESSTDHCPEGCEVVGVATICMMVLAALGALAVAVWPCTNGLDELASQAGSVCICAAKRAFPPASNCCLSGKAVGLPER